MPVVLQDRSGQKSIVDVVFLATLFLMSTFHPCCCHSFPARASAGGLWLRQLSASPVSPSCISPCLPFMFFWVFFLLCMMNVIAFALFN